jgi:hypothetical protein
MDQYSLFLKTLLMFNLDDPRMHQHAISVPFVTLCIIANVKESLKYQKLTCSCLARLAMHYTSTVDHCSSYSIMWMASIMGGDRHFKQ